MNKKTFISFFVLISIAVTGVTVYFLQNQSKESYQSKIVENNKTIYLNFKMLFKYPLLRDFEVPKRIIVKNKNLSILELLENNNVHLKEFEKIPTKILKKDVSESITIDLIPKDLTIKKTSHLKCSYEELVNNDVTFENALNTIKIMKNKEMKFEKILEKLKNIYQKPDEKKFLEKYIKKVFF
ncbi:hypothetical protein SSABA_v1c04740 [Spiroplasma sabaudiense Ar-1343]|uniref:Transmembrane protein n=1 Tax=Spiroplasma sabaudiense Ar-1343 TaxID=1276257 RepID=W6AA49_9MOLU|nr:hypothetical protein [Spiroplasma sabaudiense]AHI53881.1 hypothetical protein SSABA_v1c04740 [Spiroplasma sabaudiense Ar-1343]